MEAMAAAEFCVSMRFHSCVFATEVGVPFLAVDYTAGGKIQAMLEDTGQECRCARLSDLPGIGKEDFERKVFFKADSPDSAKQSVAKRVLHLLPRVTGGGGARAAIWMARDSKKSGGPDHLVVSLDAADETGLAVASENRVEVMDRPSAGQLRRALEEADIVVAHWWNCPQFAQLFSRELPPMRLMIWLHVAGYHAPQLIRPELLRFADMAIACSPHTYAHPAFDALSASERNDRTAMILAGADFSRLHGAVPRLHSGFNVGYIGTLDPVKMHPDFVEMSHGVKIADVRFTVCGNGDAQWLRDRAKKLGSLERFDIRGSVSNIREVIEEMDVYGYPLCPETYAAAELNLQEVMYAGVPVVAFPHGGIARLIEHGQTGLLVNSPEEYAAAIEFLHANPQERTRIGGNAAEYARRHWGSEAAARAFNIQFERITKEPKRARVLTDSNVADTSLSSLPRDLALSPGARLFIESLGSAAEPFLQSALSSDWKVARAADERLAASSHLMRYNGIASFAEAFTRDAFLLFWMGLVQMKEGNNQQAAGFLSESIRHGFAHPRAKLHLATIAVRENRLEDAGKLVREVLRFAPTLPQIAELQQSIAAKIAKSPQENTPKRHLQRTMQFLKEGNPSQARQALGRALELAPHDLSLMELACELDCALQEFASARRLLRMITIRDPQRQSTRLVTIRGVLSRVDAAPVLPAAAGGAAAETTSTMAPTP
jgi:glycosyltransferase involved in cell wall biosynthesis